MCERRRTVPVRTLKYFRQSGHQYGIGLAFGTVLVLRLPQCPQHRSLPQKMLSNHLMAACSSGNLRVNCASVIPFL